MNHAICPTCIARYALKTLGDCLARRNTSRCLRVVRESNQWYRENGYL